MDPGVSGNVAILAGEASGDQFGARLAGELRELWPGVKLWGVGSRAMAAAGVDLVADCATWASIGVVEALKVYPRVRYTTYPHLLAEIARRKPDVIVPIDFGAFNVRVLKWARPRGFRAVYYLPPGSWRQHGNQPADLAHLTDRIATQFPWSAERLRSVGAHAEFVGHPLLDIVRPTMTRSGFCDIYGMDPDRPIVGLLPGSRSSEVRHNLPALVGSAWIIHERLPAAQFVFGLAPTVRRAGVEAYLTNYLRQSAETPDGGRGRQLHGLSKPRGSETAGRLVTPEGFTVNLDDGAIQEMLHVVRRRLRERSGAPPFVIAQGHTHDVMAHSDVLIACSGTATLEAAIVGTPMVIMYRGSKLMQVEYVLRRVARVEHIGLPNIIAGRRIVPELLQDEASPENLARHAIAYLCDTELAHQARSDLRDVRDRLGEPGATARTARMVIEVAGQQPTQGSPNP